MPTSPFPKPMQKRRAALFWHGLFVGALLLAGMSARAGTQWTDPEAAIGEWDFLLDKSSRRCRLTLSSDPLPSGAQTIGMANVCRRMLPVLAKIDGWRLRGGDFIGFVDRAGQTILDFTTESLTANGPRGETYRLVAVASQDDPSQIDSDPIAALAVPEPGEQATAESTRSSPDLVAPAPFGAEQPSVAPSPEEQMANVRAALSETAHAEPNDTATLMKSSKAAPAPVASEPEPAETTPPSPGPVVTADPDLTQSQSEPAAPPPVQKPAEKVKVDSARPSRGLFGPTPLSPEPTHLVPSTEGKVADLNRGFGEPSAPAPATKDQEGAKSSELTPSATPPVAIVAEKAKAEPAPPSLAEPAPVLLTPPARPQFAETKMAGLNNAGTEPLAPASAPTAQSGSKPSDLKPEAPTPIAIPAEKAKTEPAPPKVAEPATAPLSPPARPQPAETKRAGLTKAVTEPTAAPPATKANVKSNETLSAPTAPPPVAPKPTAPAPVPSRPIRTETAPEPARQPVKVAARPALAAPLKPGDVAGHYAILREGGRDTGCMLTLNDKAKGRSGDKAILAPACRDQGIVIFDPVGWQIIDGKLVLTARKGHSTQLEYQPDGTWSKTPKQGKPLALKRL
jgi:hypothetical protein